MNTGPQAQDQSLPWTYCNHLFVIHVYRLKWNHVSKATQGWWISWQWQDVERCICVVMSNWFILMLSWRWRALKNINPFITSYTQSSACGYIFSWHQCLYLLYLGYIIIILLFNINCHWLSMSSVPKVSWFLQQPSKVILIISIIRPDRVTFSS